jgi:hypothetical protein
MQQHTQNKHACTHVRMRRTRTHAHTCTASHMHARACVEYVSTIQDVSSHRHPTGRPAASPDGYGLRTRTDGPDQLRRPSHPPDFQGGPNAHEHGSCHVRHHPLMGMADVNRCGSV